MKRILIGSALILACTLTMAQETERKGYLGIMLDRRSRMGSMPPQVIPGTAMPKPE